MFSDAYLSNKEFKVSHPFISGILIIQIHWKCDNKKELKSL